MVVGNRNSRLSSCQKTRKEDRMPFAFSFVKVKHIGLVVPDLNASMAAASQLLGLGAFRVIEPEAFEAPPYYEKKYRGSDEDFAFRCAYAPMGPLEIEFIQPVKGKTVYDDFLRETGGGLHHFAIEVQDLERELERMVAAGGAVIQSAKRTGLSWAYVELGSLNGLVLELIQPKVAG